MNYYSGPIVTWLKWWNGCWLDYHDGEREDHRDEEDSGRLEDDDVEEVEPKRRRRYFVSRRCRQVGVGVGVGVAFLVKLKCDGSM